MAVQKGFAYRSHYDIKREILALVSAGPTRKTHVMYGVKLSFPQLETYLDNLISSNLVVLNEDGLYEITQTGKRKLAVLKEACA